MSSFTIFDLYDLNNILKEKKLPYKIHLRDTCGNQVMWIEYLQEEVIDDTLFTIIQSFFKERKLTVQFNSSKNQFWCI